MIIAEKDDFIKAFQTVDLGSMDRVRLMNRIDTKYILSCNRLPEILNGLSDYYRILDINDIKCMPYETTYFDTEGFYHFRQHVTGNPVRYKIRFRKYASTGISYLEIKKRIGKCRTIKWRIQNSPAAGGKFDEEADNFLSTCIKWPVSDLKPVLFNSFKRITLVESRFSERATIDFGISFSDMSGNTVHYPFISVVELKREGLGNHSHLADTMKKFCIKTSGFSKYCVGVYSLNDIPSGNVLKGKISQIKKIEDEYYRYCSA